MPLNGNSFEQDPVTGFLQPSVNYSVTGFTAEKKDTFLRYFENCGNIAASIDAVGLDRRTFYNALKIDKEFEQRYNMALFGMKGCLEGTMFHNGQKPNGYMDRITWLRRHFPDEYNPKTTIQHHSDSKDAEAMFSRVLDAKMKDGSVIEVKQIPTGE